MNYTFYLAGVPADTHDTIDAVYDYFPIMISITCALVLLFVGIAFKSALIPLRSIVTIALTILWVYGFAVFVYQMGFLEWCGLKGLSGEFKALVSLVPVISFSIIVGIGLDYDIFLLVRVKEFRLSAHSTTDSFARGTLELKKLFDKNSFFFILKSKKGLYKTGGIITAAGLIMAIAFGGLLFSNSPEINQLAFFLMFAVLFDTFIVRSILVPILGGILGELNFWPYQMASFSTGVDSLKMKSHDFT